MTSDDPGDTTRETRRQPSLLRGTFSSVTSRGIFIVFGVALVFSISRNVNDVLISIRDGHFADWLLDTGNDFFGHALMALIMIAVIAPVMSLGPTAGKRRWVALIAALLGT